MESKHTYTPGPWGISEGYEGQAVVGRFDDDEYGPAVDVCGVYTTEDDAILIAAAPELLYAAIAALDCLERPHAERDENRVRVMLDVAVAKAEGRA